MKISFLVEKHYKPQSFNTITEIFLQILMKFDHPGEIHQLFEGC